VIPAVPQRILQIFKRRGRIIAPALILLLAWILWPRQLFHAPYSFVIEDKNGALLSARIAPDGQWRLPPGDSVPEKFVRAAAFFEDRRFFLHPGVDPLAMARAMVQNIRVRQVVSGGSTITMQVIRLSRKGKARTLPEKFIETAEALRLDLVSGKNGIMALYASHAPFGGNVVGLEAASWRYFGRPPALLSWAECATLAVLPNEPSLVRPGRNRERLRAKRDALLRKLTRYRVIDSLTCRLALAEPLPGAPQPLPDRAPHLCDRLAKVHSSSPQARIQTSLDPVLQDRVHEIVMRHARTLAGNGIFNAAALVVDIAQGRVAVYVGNTDPGDSISARGCRVDMITAPRSTGSVLKPLLFAAMLDKGELLPTTLVPDIPTSIGGYAPQNFNREFAGAVPAAAALARSLNIPAVRMLMIHGTGPFHRELVRLGMTTLFRPPEEYGISLILGGAEGTLFELTGIYASMARVVNEYAANREPDCRMPLLTMDSPFQAPASASEFPLSAAACWCALVAMEEVARPGEEVAWREFASSRHIAWKTGTSFGFRDAWALGCTPAYAIGVWVGNASGEGRPGLIGIETAAPILFDILSALPQSGPFAKPEAALWPIAVCKRSGYRMGRFCTEADTVFVPEKGLTTVGCPYHLMVHLDKSAKHRVSSACADVSAMVHRPWFVLPPAIEEYYRHVHADYVLLPAYAPWCRETGVEALMEFIYPHRGSAVYVPLERDGTRGRAVFRAAHSNPEATIHWHLDENFIGSTTTHHEMALAPPPGRHRCVLVDNDGRREEQTFMVIDREKRQ
jgi:penicillin-binding protein 1C